MHPERFALVKCIANKLTVKPTFTAQRNKAREKKENAELALPFIAGESLPQTLVFHSTPNFLIPIKRKRPEFFSGGILRIILGEFHAFPY